VSVLVLEYWSAGRKKKCCLSSSSFCSTPRRMCDVPTSGYIYAGKMEQELVQELQVWADCSSFSSIATVGKDYSLLRTAVDNICFFWLVIQHVFLALMASPAVRWPLNQPPEVVHLTVYSSNTKLKTIRTVTSELMTKLYEKPIRPASAGDGDSQCTMTSRYLVAWLWAVRPTDDTSDWQLGHGVTVLTSLLLCPRKCPSNRIQRRQLSTALSRSSETRISLQTKY